MRCSGAPEFLQHCFYPWVSWSTGKVSQSYSAAQEDLKLPLLQVTSKLSQKNFRGEVLKSLIFFNAVSLKLSGVEGKKSKHKGCISHNVLCKVLVYGKKYPSSCQISWSLCCLLLPRTAQSLSGSTCLTEPLFIARKSPKMRISDRSLFWLPNPTYKFVGDKKQL